VWYSSRHVRERERERVGREAADRMLVEKLHERAKSIGNEPLARTVFDRPRTFTFTFTSWESLTL